MTFPGSTPRPVPLREPKAVAVYRQFPALQPTQLPGSLTRTTPVAPLAAA